MWYIIGAIALVIVVVILVVVKTRRSSGSKSTGYREACGSSSGDPRADDPRLSPYTQTDGSTGHYPSSWHGPDEPGGSLDI